MLDLGAKSHAHIVLTLTLLVSAITAHPTSQVETSISCSIAGFGSWGVRSSVQNTKFLHRHIKWGVLSLNSVGFSPPALPPGGFRPRPRAHCILSGGWQVSEWVDWLVGGTHFMPALVFIFETYYLS